MIILADLKGPSCLSFDVFDSRSRVGVQLSSSLPQQEFNGSKVSLFHGEVFFKLGPDIEVSLAPVDHGVLSKYSRDKNIYLAKASKCFRLACAPCQ